ncbi:MAG: S8 family peptidase [Parvularculaceae bacterium]
MEKLFARSALSRTAAAAAVFVAGLGGIASAQNPPNDPYFNAEGSWGQSYPDQWALKRIGLDETSNSAWRLLGRRPSPVVIAVIDTGLDWNHADISWDQIWKNAGEKPDNGIDDDGNGFVDDVIGWDFYGDGNKPWDHDGHGTFVTGLIAADSNNETGIAGINPHARIMVLKALNNFGHSRASYLAEALVYAADNGARIVNMSVGGKGLTPTERDAVNYATSKGVFIVVAAGNEAVRTEEFGVAGLDNVMTVATTGLEDKRELFSNWGQSVDLAAPGIDILSLRARRTDFMAGNPDIEYKPGAAYVGPDKRYYRASGTSFSAPIVTGVASLLLSKNPSLTNGELYRILTQSARDIETSGVDQFTGYGIVDARAALKADPEFFVVAAIADVRIVQAGAGQAVEVLGVANANRFARAELFLGAGEEPTEWKSVGEALTDPVEDGVLGRIPAAAFAGSPVWVVRLVTTHANGKTREARYQIDLE